MNDIYKQKAEKYKYKYLKLKQELEGGEYHYNHCRITPPINEETLLLNKLIINVDYRDNNINSFNNNDYVGRLIKSKTKGLDEYNIELTNSNKNYQIIKNLNNQKMLEYIPKIVFACTIKNNKSTTYNTLKKIFEFKYCTNSNKSTKYGYIITTNIGESIYDFMSISDLIIFIPHLINAIKDFIIPLNLANFVLNNIKLDNIYWNKQKVFFNISKMKIITKDNNIDIKGLIDSIQQIYVIKKRNLKLESILTANDLINKLEEIKSNLIFEKKSEEEKTYIIDNKNNKLEKLMEKYDIIHNLTGKISQNEADQQIFNLTISNGDSFIPDDYKDKKSNIDKITMSDEQFKARNIYKTNIYKTIQ
jgi:hypothetical protein